MNYYKFIHRRHHKDCEDGRKGEEEGMNVWEKRVNTVKSKWRAFSISDTLFRSRQGTRVYQKWKQEMYVPTEGSSFLVWVSMAEMVIVYFYSWLSCFLLIIGSEPTAPTLNRWNWFLLLGKIYFLTFCIFVTAYVT